MFIVKPDHINGKCFQFGYHLNLNKLIQQDYLSIKWIQYDSRLEIVLRGLTNIKVDL